jgi:hypothetical protein
MAEDGDQGGQWLNVTQAAHRLEWPRERLRSLARRGRIQTRRSNTGELMVLLTPEMLAKGQEASPRPAHGSTTRLAYRSTYRPAHGPADDDPEVGLWAESEAVALRQQVADLRVELARAQEQVAAARAVAVADVATAEARSAAQEAAAQAKEAALRELVDEMRAALEREQARADRLEARLALPWWRRLLG